VLEGCGHEATNVTILQALNSLSRRLTKRHVVPSGRRTSGAGDTKRSNRYEGDRRPPGEAIRHALCEHPDRDTIDLALAGEQHAAFVAELRAAGVSQAFSAERRRPVMMTPAGVFVYGRVCRSPVQFRGASVDYSIERSAGGSAA
jgi:hypothetical protein